MKRFALMFMTMVFLTGRAAADPNVFTPWDALIDDPNLGPNWQLSDDWATDLYSINGGAYQLGFGLARTDGGPRGMNALALVVDGNAIGHHETDAQQGYFDVLNGGDSNIFEDLLIMVAVEANGLDDRFGLALATDANTLDVNGLPYYHAFDPNADFVYYDPNALGYDTGRPSGIYWKTVPSYDPITYLFNRGMVSILGLEKIGLAPGASARIYYDFNDLDCRAVFNVYGSVRKKDKKTGETSILVYHTNRSLTDPNDANAQVSTFAVIPPCWVLDLDGSGRVDFADLMIIGNHLGQSVDETTPPARQRVDVDGNGVIDWQDVTAFVERYIQWCSDDQ